MKRVGGAQGKARGGGEDRPYFYYKDKKGEETPMG